MNRDDEFMKFAYGSIAFVYLLVFFLVYVCYQEVLSPLIHQAGNLFSF